MQFITDLPVLVKVLGSLGIILAVNSALKNLLFSIFAGTIALGLWCKFSFDEILRISGSRLASADNIFLMVVIFQVVWLSTQMSMTGVMKDLVGAVRSRISPRASMAVLPAVIGFLPMPGGAIFSAPLVDSCDEKGEVEAIIKARTNYWFRHIWEYWWPIYPGVLMAMQITGLEPWEIMVLHFPLSLMSVLGGYLFLLRKIPQEDASAENAEQVQKASLMQLGRLVSPIIVVIMCYAVIRVFVPAVSNISRYLPMAVGILVAMLVLQFERRLDKESWKKILLSKKTVMMAAIVAAIGVYGAFIESELPNGIKLAASMRGEMSLWGIPTIMIVMLLPFISGMVTGIAVGMVGSSFPIVISLLGKDPSTAQILSTTLLAYAFGYMGMMLSPVHICLIVTNEHFSTKLAHSLRGLVLPATLVMVFAILAYYGIRVAL